MWPFNKLIDWACAESEADKKEREWRNERTQLDQENTAILEKAFPVYSTFEYMGGSHRVISHYRIEIGTCPRLFIVRFPAELKTEYRDLNGVLRERVFDFVQAMMIVKETNNV